MWPRLRRTEVQSPWAFHGHGVGWNWESRMASCPLYEKASLQLPRDAVRIKLVKDWPKLLILEFCFLLPEKLAGM